MTSYYKCLEENAYCIGTRTSAKTAGEVAPKVHGADKPLDPNQKPEHQGRNIRTTGCQHKVPLWVNQNTHPIPTPQTAQTSTPIPSTTLGGASHPDASGTVPSRKVLAPPFV